ncbi:MAG: hypothetical protein Q9227_001899 [Pyrenula ochraceoflavens]
MEDLQEKSQEPRRSINTISSADEPSNIHIGAQSHKPEQTPNDGVAVQDNISSASSISQQDKAGQDGGFRPGWKFALAMIAIMTVTLAGALDATSLSVALPIMAKKLGGTAIEAFWSGTSFLLASTAFQPPWASFSHIFGRKNALFTAIIIFTVGAIVAAVANNFTVILVGRTIQGIGGGGVLIIPEIIITDLVPLAQRASYFSLFSGVWALGSVMGPILGGGFAQNVSWRWIFWINLPFAAVGFVLAAIFLQLNSKITSLSSKLKRVDWIGMILFIASTTGLLIPISWGGVMYAWDSWHTLVPLLVSVGGLGIFLLWEVYVAAEPMMRLNIFQNRTTSLGFVITFFHGIILWSILYYLPLYFEGVKGYNPIVTGVAVFPETFTVAPAAVVTGIIITKTGRYRPSLQIGWVLATIGCGILILMHPGTSIPGFIFLNLVVGLGMGMIFPSVTISIQASSPSRDVAFAMGLFSLFRSFGQAVGIAVGGVVFQNEMKRKLQADPRLAGMASEYSADASALVQVIKTMADGSPQKTALVKAYSDSLDVVWIVMCAFAAAALVASLLVKEYGLDVAQDTEQGFVGEKKKKTQKPVDEETAEKKVKDESAV